MRIRIKHIPKYQFGGTNLGNSSDYFNNIANYVINQQQIPQPNVPFLDDTTDNSDSNTDTEDPSTNNDSSALDDLQGKFDELKAQYDQLSAENGSTGDNMLDFLFANDNSNLPMTFDNSPVSQVHDIPNVPYASSNIPEIYNTLGDVGYKQEEDLSNLGSKISKIESGGKYNATNPNSTATGKYQFLWGKKPGQGWGDSIKKITGVKNRKEFLESPGAQEKYYNWYEKNVLAPGIQQLKPYNKSGLTDTQIGKLIHFRGQEGAKQYLLGNVEDKPESYNIPISQYIANKQNGGVAITPEQQYKGLNNHNYDQMYFPNNGINTFRGLDNGKPVLLHDELGKKLILRGKHDTAQFYGNVFEKRIK